MNSDFFQNPSLVWFRNDLRMQDHEPLLRAAAEGEVLGVFCFDPRWMRETRYGFRKTGAHRLRFLKESLQDLSQSMKKAGSDLLVVYGEPEVVLPELVQQTGAERVYCHGEHAHEELDVEQAVTDALTVPLRRFEGGSMFHPDDLPFEIHRLPNGFTSFRKKVESAGVVPRKPRPAPASLRWSGAPAASFRVDGRAVGIDQVLHEAEKVAGATADAVSDAMTGAVTGAVTGASSGTDESKSQALHQHIESARHLFQGGEAQGLKRLRYYLFESHHVLQYKFTRNALFGEDTSTRFSPWLAHGCLSPRTIYAEVKRFEEEVESNVSTYWVIFELMWRDFFRFSAMRHGRRIFFKGGIRRNPPDSVINPTYFDAWANGQTGIPFIDANMRELKATGFMSNRGRQNVASFLSQNLNVDWRMGAAWFETMLLDYDVYSNWGNWAYNSTVGHDSRSRYFNILKQAGDYDAGGPYVRRWLPELASLPKEFIHKPWEMTHDQQRLFGVILGENYPRPVVDLEASYEAIRRRHPR